ncbi:MAG: hypothetical protein KatS3mg076_2039 [Candidatus Binatia bacterium]|nr:MAG: hypothetical protein KatS3mg076_2039 [Candidatus Binatia bacterium]
MIAFAANSRRDGTGSRPERDSAEAPKEGMLGGVRAHRILSSLVVLVLVTWSCSTILLRDARRKPQVYAVLVNGGGEPATNYRSHLQHLRSLVELLDAAGVPRTHLAVFSADGSDPGLDLAVRDGGDDDELWLLPRSLRRRLRPQIAYVNSELPGVELRPARKEALRTWFRREGQKLEKGDLLLFYVTDHGEENQEDPRNNFITLWGESLTVHELRDLLRGLRPGVQVVFLMSQCFSGSFANVIFGNDEDLDPRPGLCGFFSTTADRPAYGCYPENLGKEGIGHSHHFFEAWAAGLDFAAAHEAVLGLDDSPDVPLSTSDFFLEELLAAAADEEGMDPSEFVDRLLEEAWQDPKRWEPEIRLLDRIGQVFGMASPRSLAELEEREETLESFSRQLRLYASRWREALEALLVENFQEFLEERPEWKEKTAPKALEKLDEEGRAALRSELLAELAEFSASRPERLRRLEELSRKVKEAQKAAYRSDVRLGVVLRMQSLLLRVAGRLFLERGATVEERKDYEELLACERVRLGNGLSRPLPEPEPFPPLASEERIVRSVLPGWMGIRYQPLTPDQQREFGASRGAVMVQAVYKDSPAERAGLRVGDILLGPPRRLFREPHEVREWTMSRELGTTEALAVLRDGRRTSVRLRIEPYPLELPELHPPVEVGSTAPPIRAEVFRGKRPEEVTGPKLVFFWATWCQFCHAAVPEVLAFSLVRQVEVFAVTDEVPATLERFFGSYKGPFPENVLSDKYRRTFDAFGVSGTPTFVLVDENGVVRHYQAGYDLRKGLTVEGWKWGGAELLGRAEPVEGKPISAENLPAPD